MIRLPRFISDRIHRYWPMLFSGCCLIVALALAPYLPFGTGLPWEGVALTILIFFFARLQVPGESAGLARHLFLYLPGQAIAGGVCLLAGRLIWNWPWGAFAFVPIWIGLTPLAHLGFILRRGSADFKLVRTQSGDATNLLWNAAKRRLDRHDDVTLTICLLICGIMFLVRRLNPSFGLTWPGAFASVLLWLIIDRVPIRPWLDAPSGRSRLVRLAVRLLFWNASAGVGAMALGYGPPKALVAVLFVVSCSVIAFGLTHWHRVVAGSENAARTVLGLLALGLIHPFACHQLLGVQDALWYLNSLTDFLAQLRAGVFPVFVGQSEFLFNGGVLPIRFAPLFQHYGLLFNAFTLGSLSPSAVQNGVIIATFLAGAATSYAMLAWLLPGRRWLAVGFSGLFLSCPGVLAVVYYEDLFMTWTTLPWLPLVFGGCVLSFKSPGPWPLFLTGSALGIAWWGHAPVALWTTLSVALVQLARLAVISPRHWPWRSILCGAASFGAIALYPIVSVLAVPVQTGAESLQYTATATTEIVHFIQDSFPGILVPLIFKSGSLSDYQPGWPVLILLVLCAGTLVKQRVKHPALWILLAVPVGLQLMLVPIPTLNSAAWSAVPAFLRNPTGTWVMQRFYLIIAISSVCAAVALLRQGKAGTSSWRTWQAWALLAGLLWSVLAATPFLHTKDVKRREVALKFDYSLPESRVLTRYSYLVFGKPPAYYSHGHMDPLYEQRFLAPESQRLIGGNPSAIMMDRTIGRVLREGDLVARVIHPGDPWQIEPVFRLEPGKRYALDLHFNHGSEPGVLLLQGPGFNRVYALPSYGEKKSFGAGPESSSLLSVFTSGNEPVDVTLRFAMQDPQSAVDFSRFGTYRWLEVNPATLPIRVTNWIPYQAEVSAPSAAWLETPRMFQPGYRATVNGQSVTALKSREGLVVVPVPAGHSEVTLSYHPPLPLSLSYWISLLALVTCAGTLLLRSWLAGAALDPSR